MNVPRILPLIGVAMVGVVAINALSGAHDLPQFLSAARAMAEGVAPTDPAAKTRKGARISKSAPIEEAALPPAMPALANLAGPQFTGGVCAPNAADLAKSAGLSPAELQMLQSLQNRRGQIDQRERDLDTQIQLLTAAETKLDAKLKSMAVLKAEIEALMGQADQKTQGEVDRLVVVYSKMKPGEAAPVMSQLDDKVRVPVAASMKPAILAAILAKMTPLDAKKLTELLAHRFAPVQALADAVKTAAPAPPEPQAAAKAPDAKAPDAKGQAAAAAEPGDANVDDVPAKKPPVKLAKRTPPKKNPHPPKPKPAVEEAKAPAAPKPFSEVKDPQPKAADKPQPAAAAPAKPS